MMKSTMMAVLIVGAMAAPTYSFAQPGQPDSGALQREQTLQRADAGYCRVGDETAHSTAADAGAQPAPQEPDERARSAGASGYGKPSYPRSESGSREPKGPGSIYFGV
jgi:hypothetical protein